MKELKKSDEAKPSLTPCLLLLASSQLLGWGTELGVLLRHAGVTQIHVRRAQAGPCDHRHGYSRW